MHISPLEEYGIRCALQLARAEQEGGQLSASKISEREGISVEYVSKVMHLLRRAELVSASRGVQGGFFLSRSADSVKLKDVFDALQTKRKFDDDFCRHYSGQEERCVHIGGCSVRPVWNLLTLYFDRLLSEISLGDLRRNEQLVKDQVESLASHQAGLMKQAFLGACDGEKNDIV